MAHKRSGLVPAAEALADLPGPVKVIREASPQAMHHFTRFDQVDQLVRASEADADLGFMAQLLALCTVCPAPATSFSTSASTGRTHGRYVREQASR